MKYCQSALLLCSLLCLLLGATALADPARTAFSEELDANLYDCQLALTPTPTLAADAAVRLTLEAAGEQEAVRISFTTQLISLASVHAGQVHEVAAVKVALPPGVAAHFTIQRRGGELRILLGDTRLFHGEVARGTGNAGFLDSAAGWTVDDPHIQKLDPVAFADDFMRTQEENGAWTVARGTWRLASAWDNDPHGNGNHDRFNTAIYAQNPFSWVGKAGDFPAVCTTGKPIWEDYTYTVAVRPTADGAVGALVNLLDNTALLVRWSAANDRGPRGDRLTLEKIANGTSSVLKMDRGGFIPDQWYKLTVVSSLDGVRVLIDNRERLAVTDVTPWHGAVGLYTESHSGTTFDNVTVYGRTLRTELIYESRNTRIQEKFLDDGQGMRSWASPDDWFSTDDGVMINRHDYYGEQWMVFTVRPYAPAGKLVLVLHGNGQDDRSGLRAVITADAEKQQEHYQLLHDGSELAKGNGPLFDRREDTTVRFRYAGQKLTLEVDGNTMLEANDTQPAPGTRPAYRADGAFGNIRNALVLGANFLDYSFTESPVDWVGEGTWMQTIRWACQPKWSFYSGWSRGDAVLWYKQRLAGDQSLQVYMGYKMEFPRERVIYESIFHAHNACISICTDGKNPRSGYAIMSGQRNEFNRPSSETVLLRNGVPVQRVNVSVFGWGTSHRAWFNMDLRKRGDMVEFWLDGALALSYQDPHPLDGGVPAIWTSDGGISIARLRLSYANPPQPRTDAQVMLDHPWYPEWVNVGQPLALDFQAPWSTSGKPVALHVDARLAPEDAAAPVAKETQVVFTPSKIGEFWYQVTAGDGENTSPAFNLSGWAFDPALGRDDSHALVLYRFNEGSGKVVHDRSAIGEPANLQVPTSPNCHWLPGQGLSFSGPQPLLTTGGVSKLMALARNKALTIEIWASSDTAYFPIHWLGCLLTWETSSTAHNFLVGGHKADLVAAPFGGHFDPLRGDDNDSDFDGSYHAYMAFRTSLHHIVITWDGTITRGYNDGKLCESQQVDWHADQWNADTPLLLGNTSDMQRTYLGSYYLVAIHDRCLSDAEIQRNYQAGPSAVDRGSETPEEK